MVSHHTVVVTVDGIQESNQPDGPNRYPRDDDGRVRYHYVLFEYLCEYVSGEVSPGSDALEARWVKLDELDSLDIMPSTRKFLLKVLRQENTS